MKEPLIIPIPPGTTEIDLRPVLMPILRAIFDRFRNSRVEGRFTEHEVEEFLAEAFETADFYRRVLCLRADWIISWLKATGWYYSHTNQQETGAPRYARLPEEVYSTEQGAVYRERHVYVPHDDVPPKMRLKKLLAVLRDGREQSYHEPRETLAAIEAHTSIIDKLARIDDD